MIISPAHLKQFTAAIFAAAGCQADEAQRIAHYLVEANLVGHDSHGVIRIATYVQWLGLGKVLANQSIRIVSENDVIAVVDGQFGFGQTLGEQAVRLGVEKCARQGVSVVALRNAGHLGRIGDWPLMAAAEGKLSLHFVNTSGAGNLVAPFGGIDRRLSANPLAAGVPVAGGAPIILDMSACTMAEGKIRVALNKGQLLPDGCIIDAQGRPTNDPRVFYGDPLGSILPIAGHKGSGLSVLIEILSGALSGGSCTDPKHAGRLANNMLSIFLDPLKFVPDGGFAEEVNRFIAWVKSSRTITPDGVILMPGEIEMRTKAAREKAGIELDDNTWGQILDTAESFGLQTRPELAHYFVDRPQSRSADAAPSSLRGGLPAAESGR